VIDLFPVLHNWIRAQIIHVVPVFQQKTFKP